MDRHQTPTRVHPPRWGTAPWPRGAIVCGGGDEYGEIIAICYQKCRRVPLLKPFRRRRRRRRRKRTGRTKTHGAADKQTAAALRKTERYNSERLRIEEIEGAVSSRPWPFGPLSTGFVSGARYHLFGSDLCDDSKPHHRKTWVC